MQHISAELSKAIWIFLEAHNREILAHMSDSELYMIRLTGSESDEEKLFTIISSMGRIMNPVSRTVRNGVCKAQYGPVSKEVAESCQHRLLKHPGITPKCQVEVFVGRQSKNRPTAS